jgi:hypothetical protein
VFSFILQGFWSVAILAQAILAQVAVPAQAALQGEAWEDP